MLALASARETFKHEPKSVAHTFLFEPKQREFVFPTAKQNPKRCNLNNDMTSDATTTVVVSVEAAQ